MSTPLVVLALLAAPAVAGMQASGARAGVAVARESAPPAPPLRAAPYAFLHQDDGAPVRWNPCAEVPWTFNPAGAPAGGLAAVRAALAEITEITGLRFDYRGTVSTEPSGAYLKQTWQHFRPLHIGWTTSAGSDLLAGQGDATVGMTKVLWTGSYDDQGGHHTQIASAVVAFNRAVPQRARDIDSWVPYARHELGHAVGLAHVADSSQVMNAVIRAGTDGYGSGDAAGLQRLGRGAGCLPDIR